MGIFVTLIGLISLPDNAVHLRECLQVWRVFGRPVLGLKESAIVGAKEVWVRGGLLCGLRFSFAPLCGLILDAPKFCLHCEVYACLFSHLPPTESLRGCKTWAANPLISPCSYEGVTDSPSL